MPLGPERSSLVQAYADALPKIWLVMSALAAAASLASVLTNTYSLDAALHSSQSFKCRERDEAEECPEQLVTC